MTVDSSDKKPLEIDPRMNVISCPDGRQLLMIMKTTKKDAGLYECVATNLLGSVSSSCKLSLAREFMQKTFICANNVSIAQAAWRLRRVEWTCESYATLVKWLGQRASIDIFSYIAFSLVINFIHVGLLRCCISRAQTKEKKGKTVNSV